MGFDLKILLVLSLGLVWSLDSVSGLRYVIDKEECFSHKIPYEGDTVHVSFVVIKTENWGFSDDGVDLVVCLFLSFHHPFFDKSIWVLLDDLRCERFIWKDFLFLHVSVGKWIKSYHVFFLKAYLVMDIGRMIHNLKFVKLR